MKVKPRFKRYGFFQPTYIGAQLLSYGFSYMATGITIFPIVFLEECISTLNELLNDQKNFKRESPVYAYNIPFTFANEYLRRKPVAKVSNFSKKTIGVTLEISISVMSLAIACLTTLGLGLIQCSAFLLFAAMATTALVIGLALTAVALLGQCLIKGPKKALNDTAQFLNTNFAI